MPIVVCVLISCFVSLKQNLRLHQNTAPSLVLFSCVYVGTNVTRLVKCRFNVPFWSEITASLGGEDRKVERSGMSKGCMHCQNAPSVTP